MSNVVEFTATPGAKLDQIQPTSFNMGDAEQNWQDHSRLIDISQQGGSCSIDVDVDTYSDGNGTCNIGLWTSPVHPYQFQAVALSSAAITGNVTAKVYHKNDGTNYEVVTAWTQTLTNANDDTTIIVGVDQWFWDDLKVELVTDDGTASVFNYRVYIYSRGG